MRDDLPEMISHHYNDVVMSAMAFQITSLAIVYSTFYSGADQRKHESSLRGIHRWPATQRASDSENVSIWWRHHMEKEQLFKIQI